MADAAEVVRIDTNPLTVPDARLADAGTPEPSYARRFTNRPSPHVPECVQGIGAQRIGVAPGRCRRVRIPGAVGDDADPFETLFGQGPTAIERWVDVVPRPELAPPLVGGPSVVLAHGSLG